MPSIPSRAGLLKWAWIALLASATLALGWLWAASYSETPKRLYHSTDRFCSWVGFDQGRFMYWYDGGPDVRTFKPRDFRLLGLFCQAAGGMGGWQYFSAGIHGGYACAWLGVLWSSTLWFTMIRPRRRRRRGLCRKCGYDLAGVRNAVCPECGTPTR